jgi:hypothetical protein
MGGREVRDRDVSTAIALSASAGQGRLPAVEQGRRKWLRLDAHAAFILIMIEASTHVMPSESAASLGVENSGAIGRSALGAWRPETVRHKGVRKLSRHCRI